MENLPNLRTRLIASMILFIAVTTVFVVWRFIVTAVTRKRRPQLSDLLMATAWALSNAASICTILSSKYGQGYHAYDPSITLSDVVACLRLVWISQVTNIWAMFFLKISISAYLLMLDFSKSYRYIIIISSVVIVITNFVIPTISLFGACTPISYRWDRQQVGSCWKIPFDTISAYVQSITNIVTDIVYSASPLVYLASVQLPSATQWGLRIVFLCALIGTAISVAKLTQLHVLTESHDPTWDSVNLSILSNAEVSAGMIAACLPPLRSVFNRMLQRILPTTRLSSRNRSKSQLYGQSVEMKPSGQGSRHTALEEDDFHSERSILQNQGPAEIVKTVNVSVEEKQESEHSGHQNDFDSIMLVRGHAQRISYTANAQDRRHRDVDDDWGRVEPAPRRYGQ